MIKTSGSPLSFLGASLKQPFTPLKFIPSIEPFLHEELTHRRKLLYAEAEKKKIYSWNALEKQDSDTEKLWLDTLQCKDIAEAICEQPQNEQTVKLCALELHNDLIAREQSHSV